MAQPRPQPPQPPAPSPNPPTPGCGAWEGLGSVPKGNCGLGSSGSSSGGLGAGGPTSTNRSTGPPSFRGALCYNPYICSAGPAGLPQRCLGSTFVPGEALRGPFGKIFDPKIEIREHHWTLKSDFGGSKTSRPRTKMRFSRPPHCFRCNGRPQHGFQSFPRHLSTATFSWGRRQWA